MVVADLLRVVFILCCVEMVFERVSSSRFVAIQHKLESMHRMDGGLWKLLFQKCQMTVHVEFGSRGNRSEHECFCTVL